MLAALFRSGDELLGLLHHLPDFFRLVPGKRPVAVPRTAPPRATSNTIVPYFLVNASPAADPA